MTALYYFTGAAWWAAALVALAGLARLFWVQRKLPKRP